MEKSLPQGGRITVPIQYWIDSVKTKECPVSLITPRSFELVQLLAGADKVREKTGTSLDVSKVGWLWDAARVIREQEIEVEIARDKAVEKIR